MIRRFHEAPKCLFNEVQKVTDGDYALVNHNFTVFNLICKRKLYLITELLLCFLFNSILQATDANINFVIT